MLLVSVQKFASTTVQATAGAYTETKAQGTVTLYNAFSAQSWKLIAGTRLKNDSGLIYKMTSSVQHSGIYEKYKGRSSSWFNKSVGYGRPGGRQIQYVRF